jgi:3-oxoadipate enol-lactonase
MRFRLSSGLALQYRSRGTGPVIALLHPVGLSGAFWDPVIAQLESSFRLVAVDLCGHGGSDVPGRAFSLDDMAADVIELLRAVGQPPCTLVGCSMGGMVAQGIALAAPDLVSGLVVCNASHMRSPESRAAMEKRAVDAEQGMPATIATTLARWFNAEIQASQPDIVSRCREWLLEADPVVHAWSWRAIRDLAYGPRLAEIQAPTLVVTGSDDQSTPAAVGPAMTTLIRNSQHHDFAGAGHLTPLERPAEFSRVLGDFVAGHAAVAGRRSA